MYRFLGRAGDGAGLLDAVDGGEVRHFDRRMNGMLTRRQLLQTTGQGFGALAFASLQAGETAHRSQVFAPKAKRVVQLFMGGAASHIDLFDFKPELIKHHG